MRNAFKSEWEIAKRCGCGVRGSVCSRNVFKNEWENAKRCGCGVRGSVFRATPLKVNGKMQNGADAMRVAAFFAERLSK